MLSKSHDRKEHENKLKNCSQIYRVIKPKKNRFFLFKWPKYMKVILDAKSNLYSLRILLKFQIEVNNPKVIPNLPCQCISNAK
jgi:hypothetical protein